MQKYYLAVDIGASSGRHILAHIDENDKIILEEVYRFENGMEEVGGHLCWNHEKLFNEIVAGMAECKKLGKQPVCMGIDTWAVDYVLLDKNGNALGNTYGYRDHRTEGMDLQVYGKIPFEQLYERTGIARQIFNTIYQLEAHHNFEPELLNEAEQLLFVPDYFNYRLTGIAMTEYTNASTSQLLNSQTRDWDYEVIDLLGFPRKIFGKITTPGTIVGHLLPEIQEKVGYDLEVIQVATHDTASAVAAVPALDEHFLYISSGTWSLMGVELENAICNEKSRLANITNEGGVEFRFRFLKNIMGLWMIQSVRHELDDKYSFAELCDMAEKSKDFPSRVDVNDDCFLSPSSMIDAIKDYCAREGSKVPQSVGEICTVIYQSLADSYAQTVKQIEDITGKTYANINIVGGGSNAAYLNKLTANATGKTVLSGPSEATALGNILVQAIADHKYADLREARKAVYDSFEIKTYQPKE